MTTNLDRANIKPRGLLKPKTSQKHFKLDMYSPPVELETIVGVVWHVHWALPPGQVYRQSNLPHPVQHIVLDPIRGSGLVGCSTKRFDYDITGTGQVIGLKLFPGMGRAFFNGAMSRLTDQRVELESLIGTHAQTLESDMRTKRPLSDIISKFGEKIAEISSLPNEPMMDARHAVEFIQTSQRVFRVKDLAKQFGWTERHLQRLFADYVGVSPKWVIDRYRMLEAVDVLNTGSAINLAELALDLEYVDQAHFSNKFKEITGISPSIYLQQ